jgi:PAS domain S-box-containing protein
MYSKPRSLGFEELGDLSWGTHFCLFYETEQDLLETLALYFQPGLANHEYCLWITPYSSDENALNALKQVIPSIDQYREEGNLEIISCQEWYCENDEFDATRVLQAFDTKLTQALQKGYKRIRVFGDEAWLDQTRWKAFSEYEGKLDERLAGKPISILCAYPTASHDAADILDIARTHRFIAAKRNGNWEILEAPELKHVKAAAERLGAELEVQAPGQKKFDSFQRPPLILSYGLPVLAVAISLAGTFLLQPYVFRIPLFFLSIMISTWIGGIGPGLFAVLLSTLAINLFLSPAGIVETRFQDIPNMISFLVTALLVSSWSEARRRAEYALREARNELENRVQERTAELRQVNQALQAEIIEEKRTEEALRTNEYRLQAAIEAADIVLWERDLSSGRITWLGHHERLLGIAPGELDDNSLAGFEKRVHPEDIEELRRIRQHALEERSEYSHEYRVVWRDSSTHWIRAQGRFIYNEAGQPIRLYGAVLDITERKQAEEALRESEEKFSAAFRASPVALVIATLDGRFVEVNQAYCDLLGSSRDELIGKTGIELGVFTQEARQEWVEAAERHGGMITNRELSFRVRNGHSRTTLASVEKITFHGVPHFLSTILDITERKQAEEALRESEEKFSVAFRSSPIGLVIATMDGKYVEMNQAFCDLLGFSREALLGKTAVELGIFNEETRQAWVEAVERAEGKTTNVELSFRVRNGTYRTTLSSVEPITLHGAPHRLSTVLDITERKRAEEALRKSEQVLREAESLGHTGSWEQNLVTGEIFNTEENLRLFFGDDRSKGADLEDYAQVVHPDDREYVMRRRAALLEEEGPSDIEYRVVWPDGSVHVIFGRATVVRDELNQPSRVYGTNVDITERKQAEEALRLSEQSLHLLTETIPILVWSARADGVSDYYNAAFLQYLGKTLEEMQGWVWVDTLHPADRERSSAVWTQAFSSGSDYEIEYRIQRAADGQYRWHLARAVPLRDSSGKIVRWYGTCTDIHDRKQAEEKIRQYVARMEALAEISRALEEVGLDYQSVLKTLARRTAELIGDACVITLFSNDAERSFPVAFHHANPKALSMMHDALLHTWQGGTDTQRYQTLLAGGSIYIPSVNAEEFQASLEPEFWTFFEAVGISSVLIVPLKTDGHVIGTLGVTRDRQGNPYTHDDQVLLQNIADRAAMSIQNAQLFGQVQGAREQLEALSRRLLEVQEAERRALTTELHDRVGQNLTGLSITLQNMKASLSDEMAKILASKFDDAQVLVEDTTSQIRDIMAELYLPELEDYGLSAALETYAERAASRGSLELIADLPDLAPLPLPSEVRIALFRAAQEAISNVLKHANATQLEISLEGENGRVRLRVEDDGQGFDPNAASQKEGPSWGLRIMRERIESIGGYIRIESKLGQGTQVTFEVERPH